MRWTTFLLVSLSFAAPVHASGWGALWGRAVDGMAVARKIDPSDARAARPTPRLDDLSRSAHDVPLRPGQHVIHLPDSVRSDPRLARDLERSLGAASQRERQAMTYLIRLGDDAVGADGARVLPVLRNLDPDDAQVLVHLPQERAVELLRGQAHLHEAARRAADKGTRGLEPLLSGEVSLAKAYGKRSRPVLDFYGEYVRPHAGKWIAGGAIVAFLATPELFIDAAGKLTRHATENLTRLGLAIAAAPFEGLRGALRAACDPDGGEPALLCALLPAAIFVLDHLLVPLLVFCAVWAIGAAVFQRLAWFFVPVRWLCRRARAALRPKSPAGPPATDVPRPDASTAPLTPLSPALHVAGMSDTKEGELR